MSVEIPERSQIVRSTVITVALTAIFLITAIAFWAWGSTSIDSPVKMLNDFNPNITLIVETLLMLLSFIFLTVTIINLRLYVSKVRAGWTEVITVLILMGISSWLMFAEWVGMFSIVLMFAFVVYLYLLQD